jgi:hypothetical protein
VQGHEQHGRRRSPLFLQPFRVSKLLAGNIGSEHEAALGDGKHCHATLALGFINESGEPTNRYFEFLDQSQSGRVLAQGIREAYDDLFRVNKEAYKLDESEVKNKLKTLTRGEKSENVVGLMAKTFVSLCTLADWSRTDTTVEQPATTPVVGGGIPAGATADAVSVATAVANSGKKFEPMGLHYNIQIHLPASRDPAVYDAIFKSLKDHVLS